MTAYFPAMFGGLERFAGRAFAALSALAALCLAAPALASVPLQTCLTRLDPAASEAERLIVQSGAEVCGGSQAALGAGDFSVRLKFRPVVSNPEDPLVLRHTSVWQDGERIVFHYADGTTAAAEFTSATASRYLAIGAIFEIPVPARAAPLDRIQIETQGSANWRGVLLGAALMKRSEAGGIRLWVTAIYAGFAGLGLALLVYNLALWKALRYRFQAIYAAMLAALMAYTFTSSGLVSQVLPWLDNNTRLRWSYVLLASTAVAAIGFIHAYFQRNAYPQWLDRAVRGSALLLVAASLSFALFAPFAGAITDRLYFVACSLLVGLTFVILGVAWRSKDPNAPLFLLAWSAPIGVSLARSAHGLALVPYSFWLDNGNLLALGVESLLSSLLIVSRLRELSRERDKARAGEITALRLANSDHLTGLLNRRAFIDMAVGRPEPYRLILIDIDRFKGINDRLGHDTGDEVLRELARVIQAIRPADSLAVRLGGEEFALLIPLGEQDACTPDAILEAVRAHKMPFDLRVTVSLGFADGRINTDECWRRLYRLADSALYRAKADGRDRACRATDFAEIAAA
ncbi:MAG TPA: diguanylate cyclase [Novosphingobium sp.]|nr:diguanylate cyclase [Novosphingobium sp.]